MKLLFINYEFPPLGGGGGRAMAHIARHLSSMGHDVLVLTSAYKGLSREETKDGYRVIRIPTLRRYQEKCRIFEMLAFMVSSLFYSLKWARKWRPNMSISFFTLPCGPAAYLLKKIYRIPYIISLRGGDVPGFMKEQLGLYHRLTRPLIRFIWKRAKAVVANSEGLKSLALQTTNKVDITMIPNGVDSLFFDAYPQLAHEQTHQKIAHQSQPSQKPFRFLTVGRLTPQKDIESLLDAFCQVRARVQKPAQLWIVGDGPLRKNLEARVHALNLGNSVSFFGWQEPEVLKSFYKTADTLVLSSLYEGMPNVVLEAMAMGLPIVGTDVAGTRELIQNGDNGYLVPPQNPEVLAKALLKVVQNNDLLNQMSQSSRRIAQRYDWKKVAVGYLELCQNLS